MKIQKRINLSIAIAIAFGVTFFTSCSSTPESLKTIPKETTIVSAVDLYSVIKKGDLQNAEDLNLFKTVKKEIRSESKDLAKIVENIIETPSITGINFTKDIFAFYTNEYDDEKFICISAVIKNGETFEEFIEDLFDEIDIDYDTDKETEYTIMLVEEEMAIGWDKSKVVFMFPENYKSEQNLDLGIENLFTLKAEDQITAVADFKRFYKNKKDINLWLSTNLFEDSYDFKDIEDEIDIDLTDNYISMHLNFDKDNISLLSQFTPNSELQQLMDENNMQSGKINASLLKVFPEESYAAASTSFNPKAYLNVLKDRDEYDDIESEFEKVTELELKDVIESINGGVVYSLFGFEKIKYTYTGWGYSFDESAANKLDERYEISEAGELSDEDKELLNQGQTIQASTYSYRYCINIANILENGGTVETAIENDSKINWYEGGWEYNNNIEKTKEEFLPLMGLSFDINNKSTVKDLLAIIPEGMITEHDDYIEFKVDGRYPAYFAYNASLCFVTNDIKSIEAFKDGGYSSNSLNSSSLSSNITNSTFYSFLNLKYDEYPEEFQQDMMGNTSKSESELLDSWDNFAKSIELKQNKDNSVELIFNTESTGDNSLSTLITTIDNNYKHLLSL